MAQEVGHSSDVSFFAATPPLESKRMLLSQWATEKTRKGAPLKISFVDVKKAYLNGRPSRKLYVRPPPELGLPKNVVCRLDRCMYGCRDAGAIWEIVYSSALVAMGFQQGKSSPCCFYHPTWDLQCVVHGDDFTCLGTASSLDKWEAGMKEAFDVKLKGRLGTGPEDEKHMRVLNRLISITKDGLTYESDPRHVEILARDFGLDIGGKSNSTPGTKQQYDPEKHLPKNEDHVSIEDVISAIRIAK